MTFPRGRSKPRRGRLCSCIRVKLFGKPDSRLFRHPCHHDRRPVTLAVIIGWLSAKDPRGRAKSRPSHVPLPCTGTPTEISKSSVPWSSRKKSVIDWGRFHCLLPRLCVPHSFYRKSLRYEKVFVDASCRLRFRTPTSGFSGLQDPSTGAISIRKLSWHSQACDLVEPRYFGGD